MLKIKRLPALLLVLMVVSCSSATPPDPEQSNSSLGQIDSRSPAETEQELFPQIAAGVAHICLLNIKGEVLCWPSWEPEAPEDFFKAYHVDGLADDVTAIAIGAYHSCALMRTGEVQCWGQNSYGQLGNGTTVDSATPVPVQGLSGPVVQLAAGYAHTCALLQAGEVQCWGQNTYSQLGDGTTRDSHVPITVQGLTVEISTIKAGWSYTCAIDDGGRIGCWGLGPFDPDNGSLHITLEYPTHLDWLGSEFQAMAAGVYHLCLVTMDGAVQCRGSIFSPENPNDGFVFDTIKLTGNVRPIVAGADFNCVLTDMGGVKCWGDNYFGQLGDGTYLANNPVDVLGLTEGVVSIGSGEYIGCALLSSGAVECWGDTSFPMTGAGRVVWK